MRHSIKWLLLFISLSLNGAVPKKVEVVIVGAGLSGLATARHLKKAGISFHLLEITPRLGGRVRTVKYERDGETLYSDSGMEEYWESNPAVAVLKELKLPLRSDTAVSSLILQNQLYPMGEETSQEFRNKVFSADELASWEKFQNELTPMVADLRTDKPIRPELLALKEGSFAAWVTQKNLPPKLAQWIRVMVECEIGTEWDKISAIDGIAEMHIFLGKDGEKSVRVLGGNESFTTAFAASVGLKNISLNKAVKTIRSKKDSVEVTYLDMATNQNAIIVAKKVVTTVPLYRLFEIQFEPLLSDVKQKAIGTQSWGAYFKAHAFVPKSAEKYWMKNGASILPILSDSKLGVIYDGNPNQKTKSRILSLLVYGSNAESFNMMPQEVARGELRASFDKLWPGIGKEIQEIEFYRFHPRAIAAWGVGRSRFDELSRAIRTPENNVYLAGDFTESSHSDGAFRSAERVSSQIQNALRPRKVSNQ